MFHKSARKVYNGGTKEAADNKCSIREEDAVTTTEEDEEKNWTTTEEKKRSTRRSGKQVKKKKSIDQTNCFFCEALKSN